MSAAGQIARGWDLDRIIQDYEQRINTLEKLSPLAGLIGTWAAVPLQAGITTLATLNYRVSFGLVFLSGKVSLDVGLAAGGSKVVAAAGSVPNARDSMDYAEFVFDGAHKLGGVSVDGAGTITARASATEALGAGAQFSFNFFYEAA